MQVYEIDPLTCPVLRIGSALGAAPAVPAPSPSSLLKARVSEVIDGDTVRVWLDGKEELVRYLAIEAPKLSEAGGLESRQVHQKLLSSGQVWLECDPVAGEPLGRDGRRRLLAYAFAEQTAKRCLNTESVRLGAAKVGIRSVNDDTHDIPAREWHYHWKRR